MFGLGVKFLLFTISLKAASASFSPSHDFGSKNPYTTLTAHKDINDIFPSFQQSPNIDWQTGPGPDKIPNENGGPQTFPTASSPTNSEQFIEFGNTGGPSLDDFKPSPLIGESSLSLNQDDVSGYSVHPEGLPVPQIIKVPVPKPYVVNVPVPQPVAIPIYKLIPQEVIKKVPITVEKLVPVYVKKPYPIEIVKHHIVEVPKHYKIEIPIIKHVYIKTKTKGWRR